MFIEERLNLGDNAGIELPDEPHFNVASLLTFSFVEVVVRRAKRPFHLEQLVGCRIMEEVEVILRGKKDTFKQFPSFTGLSAAS